MTARKIFLIAGEASGDLLGAALMKDLKEIAPDITFSGIGGADMMAQGMDSLFPMSDLSVMGLAEVVKHLPRLIGRINQTFDAVLREKPDILVTIDAPDFCFRVARKIKRKNPVIKIVHMVAPTVWAWRPGRAKKIARFLDGLLCLYPFEPPYFSVHGLRTEFMGHPLEKIIPPVANEDKADFFRRHRLNTLQPLLCLLPGSRSGEIDALLPLFLGVVTQVKKTVPDLQIILPTLAHKLEKVQHHLATRKDIHVFVPQTPQEKYVAFASSTAALHASGTVALELALCATPMVTAYKVSALTAVIMRRLVRTPFANLVNILSGKMIAPEFIQDDATTENLTREVLRLLTNNDACGVQSNELQAIRQSLKEKAPQVAARFVLSVLSPPASPL